MSENKTNMAQQQQMMREAAWLMASNSISRLLGVFYIIPWYAWMGTHGEQASAFFRMGYNIYAAFLLISTAGIPVVIAKQVSKYNTLGREDTSYYLLRKILGLTLVLGLIFAAIMYTGSPVLAAWSSGGADLVRIMKSLSWALLLFPSMGVLHDFFRGLNNLKPYAMSQVAERIIRVIWILLAAFMIMRIGSGDYVSAVVQSAFAALIGMIASVLALLFFLWRKGKLQAIFSAGNNDVGTDANAIIIETIKEAIPFIITGAVIQLLQIVNQLSSINTMRSFTSHTTKELQILYAYLSNNPNKVTMILISLATAIDGTSIPLLTEDFVNKNKETAARLIISSLQMLCMVLFPTVLGAIVLARPVHTLFYSASNSTALWLFAGALMQVVFLALYSLLAPMLQALFEDRKAIRYFGYGLAIKIILQILSICFFHAYDPLLSIAIGLTIPIALTYRRIHEVTRSNREVLWQGILLVSILTVIMGVVIAIAAAGPHSIVSPTTRVGSIVYTVFVGTLGILVYGFLALVTRLLGRLIGDRAKTLRQKLHLE